MQLIFKLRLVFRRLILESASAGTNYTVDVRRHSEGCQRTIEQQPQPGRTRRVSFDKGIAEGELVRCRYSKCAKAAPLAEARKTFKTCHNCTHVYCSRECRRAHWEKHRKTCLHSRVGALCRKVISNVKEDDETLHHVSLLARRGFLSRGRGTIKLFFSSTENAEGFVAEGFRRLGDPTYVRWADLTAEETGQEMQEELVRLCKAYNPERRLVVYVAVCVVSEVPTSGAVKWERQLVTRCANMRLSRRLLAPPAPPSGGEASTLILTSLPGSNPDPSRARQVSFTNIQRHLRQRGVSLRRHFPEVYKRLCDYVEGTTERFTPVTVYPRDALSGKTFMCVIMPDAEPEKLSLIPTEDNIPVYTIDISVEPEQV
ncbi:hypothetical protein AAG570_011398 [Ranatra chinensis]|uniref:MYND-type domain-containing protein n=1 Tax=Ranatra chinensis TaxID=642074 RepID=A0ABD0YKR7_9HEMI